MPGRSLSTAGGSWGSRLALLWATSPPYTPVLEIFVQGHFQFSTGKFMPGGVELVSGAGFSAPSVFDSFWCVYYPLPHPALSPCFMHLDLEPLRFYVTSVRSLASMGMWLCKAGEGSQSAKPMQTHNQTLWASGWNLMSLAGWTIFGIFLSKPWFLFLYLLSFF